MPLCDIRKRFNIQADESAFKLIDKTNGFELNCPESGNLPYFPDSYACNSSVSSAQPHSRLFLILSLFIAVIAYYCCRSTSVFMTTDNTITVPTQFNCLYDLASYNAEDQSLYDLEWKIDRDFDSSFAFGPWFELD